MPTNTYNLLLFGGGIDSVCLAGFMHDRRMTFDLLTINYGQKAWVGEEHAAKTFADIYNCQLIIPPPINPYYNCNHPMLDAEMAKDHQDNVLWMRNQILFDVATLEAVTRGYRSVIVGFHKEPKESQFYDAMPAFLNAYNTLLAVQKIPVHYFAPFIRQEKKEYIKYTTSELINKSHSCYESRTTNECGECTHCKQKKIFFQEQGLSLS